VRDLCLGCVVLLSTCLYGCADEPATAFLADARCEGQGSGPFGVAVTAAVHYRSFDSGTLDEYEVVREEVDWLAHWAETHGLVLELALNGYQAEGALAAGEEQRYGDLAAAGHGFGVHHHPRERVDELTWIELETDPADEDLQRAVDDHREWIGLVLDDQGVTYPGGHVRLTGRSDWWHEMMLQGGYETETLDAWSRSATSGAELQHSFDVIHPFRWRVGGDEGTLEHDPTVPFVAVPQHPQVGSLGLGEHQRFDGSVAHLKALSFLAYLEWRAAALEGVDAPCFATGVTVHPELGAAHNERLDDLGQFLADTFIDPSDELVGRSMCPVRREEIVAQVEAWEERNPDTSPFDYVPGDGYPHRLCQLADLYDARLVAVHDDHLERGVRVIELQRMTDPGEGELEDFVPGERLLLAWADVEQGEVEVDVSGWLDGELLAVTGCDSAEGVDVDASAVHVGTAPVVLLVP
jgi:hypothetical protein